MDNSSSNENILRYLRNEMTAKELSDFTLQMVLNPSTRKEVEATRMVFKTIRSTDMKSTSTSVRGNKTVRVLILLGLLLFSGLAYLYFNMNGQDKHILPKEELILPALQPAKVPIASAFEENVLIENGLGLRSKSGKTKVTNFEVGLNQQYVEIKGIFAPEITSAKVRLWNNQKEAFEEEQFLFEVNLDIAQEGVTFLKVDYRLSSGLYYYELEIDRHLSQVGKFTVGK